MASPEKSTQTSYNVYTAKYHGIPNHIAIYFQTMHAGMNTGEMFHVTGSILRGKGMEYQNRDSIDPVESASYDTDSKTKIGTVKISNIALFKTTCESVPVPGPQPNLNGSRMDKSNPVRRCTEWVKEAVEALLEAGIVEP